MRKNSLLFTLIFLFYPHSSFSFSESELDSLEESGKKTFSKSPWRTELSLGLHRNAHLNTFHSAGYEAQQSVFSTDEKDSLLDFANLYYSIGLGINYSFMEVAEKRNYEFLKNMELFLSGSFDTPWTGYNNQFEDYDAWQYIHYAIGDLTFGLTTPLYQKQGFITYFSSYSLIPLSKFSQEAGLFSGLSGSLSFLYFLQRKSDWSLAVSSNHALHYRHYIKNPLDRAKGDKYQEFLARNDKELTHDRSGHKHTTPLSTGNSGNLIFKQSAYKVLPTRISFTLGYIFGADTRKTRTHYLSWSGAASWKVKNHFYLNTSIRWMDSIHISNPVPEHKDITKHIPIGWSDLRKYIFSIGVSYSF